MLTKSRRIHPLLHAPAAAALAGALASVTGCATLPPPVARVVAAVEPSRAEAVFLYQSRVADALLDRYPLLEVFEEADPALRAAEARMTESCSPLTRAVLARLEGERPSIGLRLQVFTSIDDCEQAARRMERLLDTGRTAERAPNHSI